MYRIVATLVSERAGIVAGVLAAVAPANPVYSLLHMPDAPANALWLVALYLLARGSRMNSPWGAILVAGICSALAAVTKPVYFFLYAPTAVGIFLFLWPQWRKGAVLAVLFLVGFAAGVAPCYVRNYMIWGEPVFSPQGGSQLYLFVRPRLLEADGPVRDEANLLSGGYRDSRVPPTKEAWEQKFGSSWDNLAKRTRVYGQLAVDDIEQHAARFIKLWALAQVKLYGGTGTVTVSRIVEPSRAQQEAPTGFAATWEELWKSGWWIYQVISWLLLAIIYLGAIAGVVALIRRKQYAVLFTVLMFLAYFACAVTLWPSTRYRFPMMSLFAMLAGCAVEGLTNRTETHSLPGHTEANA